MPEGEIAEGGVALEDADDAEEEYNGKERVVSAIGVS